MSVNQQNIKLIFGLKLRQLRLDNGLSLAELSKKSKISISYLNEIEKAKKYPKPDKIAALATAFDVSYDWMVSLQLHKKLAPVSELIRSNILQQLPLDMFGIEPGELLELLTNAPTKLNAFVSTLIEIGRNYDLSVENFHYSVLRSYQEMHENYFEDLEKKADNFVANFNLTSKKRIDSTFLEKHLIEQYAYEIDYESLTKIEPLKDLRSVLQKGTPDRLLINNALEDNQRTFILAREVAFHYLGLKERGLTSPLFKPDGFEMILNNFKASYFASALLINRDSLVKDLRSIFGAKTWQPEKMVSLISKYNTTPEMLLQRMTNVLPKFLGINQLFFLRFSHRNESKNFLLTKEMHLAELHSPHATALHEHYCRRWVSLTILQELEKKKKSGTICRAQISDYIDSDNKYFIFALANHKPKSALDSSVSIGFAINDRLRKRIDFLDDPKLKTKNVSETCERCPAIDCKERLAEPTVLRKREKIKNADIALAELLEN